MIQINDDDVSAIDALGKVLGIDIEFAEQVHGGKANGSHDKNGKITIAVDASNPFVTVLNHEITHDLQVKSPELYKKYRDYVISELKAQDPELFEALFNHYASMYGYEKGDISREGILDEIAADASEKFLQDEKAIKKLAKENRNLAERILGALRNIISKIKKAMEGLEPRTATGVLLNRDLDIAKKAEKLWLEALSDVASNKGTNATAKAKEAASVKDDVRYSIKTAEDGSKIVVIDTDQGSFVGTDVSEYSSIVRNIIKDRYRGIVLPLSENELAYVPRKAEGEYAYPNIKLNKNSTEYKAKMKAATELHNLLLTSEHSHYAKDKKKHSEAKLGWDYYSVKFIVDGKLFEGLINIANSENNRVFYDITKVKAIPDISSKYFALMAQSTSTYENRFANTKISQSDSDVNTIISLDNRNDTIKNKFSLKDYEPIDFDALIKENKKLKEVNAILKEQFRITKGVKLDQKAVDKLANKIVKNYSSSYDSAVLSKQLNELFAYIANGKEVNFDTVVDVGANIGRQVLEQTEVADTSYVDRYSELKRDIRNTRLYVPDNVKADIGDYGGFLRSNFGRLRLVNDRSALHIDSYFKELSSEYPVLFNEEETAVPSDQLQRIADIAASFKEITYKPFDEKNSGDIDTASTAFAYELFEEYFNVPQMNKTFADQKRAELNRTKAQYKRKITEIKADMKIKYDERLTAVKEQNAAKIAELTKKAEKAQGELKDKYNARIEALRDHRNERLQAQALKYQEQRKTATKKRNESAAVRKYKNWIIKNVTELGNWLLKPSDKKHVNKGLEKLVTEFLSSIDFSSNRLNKYGEPTKRTQLWNKLKDRYSNILISYSDISSSGNDPVGDYIEVDVDLIEKLQSLVDSTESVRLEDMTAEQLKTLSEVVAAVKKSITDAGIALSDGKKQEISTVGEGLIADNKDRKVKTSRGGPIDAVGNMLNLHMLDANTFFEKLGSTMQEFYQGTLRAGLNKKISCLQEATEYARPMLEGVNVKELSEKTAKVFSFEIESGDKIQMTTAQIMSLYCLNKREQAKGHIYKGGIRPSVIERITGKFNIISYDPVQVSQIDVGNILSVLTTEQKQLAEGLAGFFEVTSKWGNEVSRMLYGYDKFTESNYFPIVSDSNYTLKPEGQQVTSIETLKNLGMTKATVKGANNPIIVEDIFDVFTRQVDQMSSYNAFVVPVSDMQKLYNYKVYAGEGVYSESVKKTIEKVLGKGGKEYYLNLLNDINGNKMTGSVDGIFNRMLSNAKIAAVGANLRVVIQQPTSYFRAMNELDPKYLAKGLAKKGDFEKVKKYAKIAQWKDWGFFEINTGRQINDIILGRENFGSKTLKAAGAADNITWAKLWNAVEYEIADTRPELEKGSEQFNEVVAERFSEVVDKTQVVDSVLHRSEIMRSKDGLVKLSTSFMSEPIKTYNMLYSSLTSAMQEKAKTGKVGKAASGKIVRAGVTHLITSAATAAVESIIDAFRDDDDDKWIDKYGEAFISNFIDNINPLNMIPIARDMVSIYEGFQPSRLDTDGLSEFTRVARKTIDYFDGNSKNYKFSTILKDLVGSISKLTGIPIKNIMRELEMVGDIILDGLEKAGMNTTAADFAVLKSFYSPLNATGKTKYYDLLYKAKVNKNMRMYNEIQKFMLQSGVKESAVRNAVKNRGTKELLENELVIKAAKSKKAGKGWSLWMEKLVKEGYTTAQVNAAINALIEKELV